MKLLNLIIALLSDEILAVITYAMDEYEPLELEMSPRFMSSYNSIKDNFNDAYIERKLDFCQFEADYRQVCPHCGKDLDNDSSR